MIGELVQRSFRILFAGYYSGPVGRIKAFILSGPSLPSPHPWRLELTFVQVTGQSDGPIVAASHGLTRKSSDFWSVASGQSISAVFAQILPPASNTWN
jgi:hypothetical protein